MGSLIGQGIEYDVRGGGGGGGERERNSERQAADTQQKLTQISPYCPFDPFPGMH